MGDAAFAREARVVPLGGGKGRRASRAASYDHALASLCDLRMNKLCGSVVEQRFEQGDRKTAQAIFDAELKEVKTNINLELSITKQEEQTAAMKKSRRALALKVILEFFGTE